MHQFTQIIIRLDQNLYKQHTQKKQEDLPESHTRESYEAIVQHIAVETV